jgi:hypothetical protein
MKDNMNSWNERKQVHDEVITWARHDQLVKILLSVHKIWWQQDGQPMKLFGCSIQSNGQKNVNSNKKNDVIHTKRKVANL